MVTCKFKWTGHPIWLPHVKKMMLPMRGKLSWDSLLKHFSTASLCGLGFSGHVRWVPKSWMLDVPKGQKRKLLAQLRAFPINDKSLLLLCFTSQGCHRAHLDLKG